MGLHEKLFYLQVKIKCYPQKFVSESLNWSNSELILEDYYLMNLVYNDFVRFSFNVKWEFLQSYFNATRVAIFRKQYVVPKRVWMSVRCRERGREHVGGTQEFLRESVSTSGGGGALLSALCVRLHGVIRPRIEFKLHSLHLPLRKLFAVMGHRPMVVRLYCTVR